MYRLSRCVLLAHEDKVFQGAIVASMSIPWGETKGDNDLGGYHLVWTRDLVQSATALLATGQTSTPLRALTWLAAIQRPDGSFPRTVGSMAPLIGLANSSTRLPRQSCWDGVCHKQDALGLFSPRVMIVRAAAHLILQGPVTSQDRWEENAGYSPSTLATVIAALVWRSRVGNGIPRNRICGFCFAYADWLAAHIEEWMVTTQGELVEGFPHHYIRINPTDPNAPDPHPDPNTTMIQIANGGGLHPAAEMSSAAISCIWCDSAFATRTIQSSAIQSKVIDRVLKHDLPQGPGWRRYNHDGYGQKDDVGAFDGTGVGRCWPILTGRTRPL